MAKLRLNFAYNEIIMSKIISVIINDVEFKKSDYIKNIIGGGRVIQEFYIFVKRNKEHISFISYKIHNSDDHINCLHLKNCKLHNLNDKALRHIYGEFELDSGYYYIDGEKLTYKDWKQKIRTIKLKTLNNDI